MEVDSADELFDLFAPVIDYLRIETHPLITVEKLGEFLERDATASRWTYCMKFPLFRIVKKGGLLLGRR
jgi:hypothetical protein